MFEPAAVMVVLGAVAAARLAAGAATQPAALAPATHTAALAPRALLATAAATVVTAAIVVVTGVLAVGRGRDEARDLSAQRVRTVQVDALRGVVDRLGGPARVRACGEVISNGIGDQTLLAWTVGENVSEVGYRFPQPGDPHNPVVLFTARGRGWAVRVLRQTAPGCRAIAQRSGRSG
jgi:hypothetical protein